MKKQVVVALLFLPSTWMAVAYAQDYDENGYVRCTVKLVDNRVLGVPYKGINDACMAAAKACARRMTGKDFLQAWWGSPDAPRTTAKCS